jgi:hypothetical protein
MKRALVVSADPQLVTELGQYLAQQGWAWDSLAPEQVCPQTCPLAQVIWVDVGEKGDLQRQQRVTQIWPEVPYCVLGPRDSSLAMVMLHRGAQAYLPRRPLRFAQVQAALQRLPLPSGDGTQTLLRQLQRLGQTAYTEPDRMIQDHLDAGCQMLGLPIGLWTEGETVRLVCGDSPLAPGASWRG